MRLLSLMPFPVALLALLGAGCSADTGDGATAGAQRLTITVGDSLSFEPAALTVQAGRPVLLTVKNVGNTDHDLVIAGMPARDVTNAIEAGHGHAAAGTIVGHPKTKGEVTVRFTPIQPGVYEFSCSVTGHREAGMTGTVTVT